MPTYLATQDFDADADGGSTTITLNASTDKVLVYWPFWDYTAVDLGTPSVDIQIDSTSATEISFDEAASGNIGGHFLGYIDNPTAGSSVTISWDWANAAGEVQFGGRLYVVELQNAATGAPQSNGYATGNNVTLSVSIANAATSDMMCVFVSGYNESPVITHDTGFTLDTAARNDHIHDAYRTDIEVGTYDNTGTQQTQDTVGLAYGVMACCFIADSGGAAVPPLTLALAGAGR